MSLFREVILTWLYKYSYIIDRKVFEKRKKGLAQPLLAKLENIRLATLPKVCNEIVFDKDIYKMLLGNAEIVAKGTPNNTEHCFVLLNARNYLPDIDLWDPATKLLLCQCLLGLLMLSIRSFQVKNRLIEHWKKSYCQSRDKKWLCGGWSRLVKSFSWIHTLRKHQARWYPRKSYLINFN